MIWSYLDTDGKLKGQVENMVGGAENLLDVFNSANPFQTLSRFVEDDPQTLKQLSELLDQVRQQQG